MPQGSEVTLCHTGALPPPQKHPAWTNQKKSLEVIWSAPLVPAARLKPHITATVILFLSHPFSSAETENYWGKFSRSVALANLSKGPAGASILVSGRHLCVRGRGLGGKEGKGHGWMTERWQGASVCAGQQDADESKQKKTKKKRLKIGHRRMKICHLVWRAYF